MLDIVLSDLRGEGAVQHLENSRLIQVLVSSV